MGLREAGGDVPVMEARCIAGQRLRRFAAVNTAQIYLTVTADVPSTLIKNHQEEN
jgi:hypothetical protein